MAISRKSTFMVRIVALGALALMVLAVIVCIVFLLKAGPNTEQYLILPDTLPSDIPPPSKGNNAVAMILFVVFLIALFVMVVIVAMREQKRNDGKEVRPEKGGW